MSRPVPATRFDIIVIGSGPAGCRAAIQAAKFDRSVLVIEDRPRIGGASVHSGTIPSKILRETVLNLTGWRERAFTGLARRRRKSIDRRDLLQRLERILNFEVGVLELQFARNRVRTVRGRARFLDPHRIAVDTGEAEPAVYAAEHFIIAVGTRPFRPPRIPFDGKRVVDSDGFVEAPHVPRSLTVVGAGVIGIEYASLFSALDVPVTVVEPREDFLEFIDREVRDHFIQDLSRRGVTFRLGCSVEHVEIDATGSPIALLSDGRHVRSGMLLYAAGRVGATDGLGLEACGLATDYRGRLAFDPRTFQTGVPHIYAAGDVIGHPNLASISMEQGRIAACHACGQPRPEPPAFFPYGIYAVPEIASVGLTEEQARARAIPYEVGIARAHEISRGHIMGALSGMLKLVASRDDRRVLGVHIVGEGATELIHVGQAVINLGGTVDYFVDNAFNYPALADAYKLAGIDAFNRMAAPPLIGAAAARQPLGDGLQPVGPQAPTR